MTELKPCPFCGNKDVILYYCGTCGQSRKRWQYVGCNHCEGRTGSFDTEQQAVEAWNRRADK